MDTVTLQLQAYKQLTCESNLCALDQGFYSSVAKSYVSVPKELTI